MCTSKVKCTKYIFYYESDGHFENEYRRQVSLVLRNHLGFFLLSLVHALKVYIIISVIRRGLVVYAALKKKTIKARRGRRRLRNDKPFKSNGRGAMHTTICTNVYLS
uniref:Uncharacterized protein n=1 Tax=Schizaphis graminum TaxID=13262 RepID=A0A2S2PGT6_SCHGA